MVDQRHGTVLALRQLVQRRQDGSDPVGSIDVRVAHQTDDGIQYDQLGLVDSDRLLQPG